MTTRPRSTMATDGSQRRQTGTRSKWEGQMLRRIGSLVGTIVTARSSDRSHRAAYPVVARDHPPANPLRHVHARRYDPHRQAPPLEHRRRPWRAHFLVIITVLTVLVFRFWRRRLRIFSIALIIFAALNLTAARHLLRTWLIPPLAPALGQQYVHAVLTDNRVAALDLSEQSDLPGGYGCRLRDRRGASPAAIGRNRRCRAVGRRVSQIRNLVRSTGAGALSFSCCRAQPTLRRLRPL